MSFGADRAASMRGATTFVFVGRFEPGSFAEFVHHRARRLALSVGIGTIGPNRIEVFVSGDPALVDAFEMACSLGPIDCLVFDTFRSQDGKHGRQCESAGGLSA
jgi:hypothetical protein